MLRLGTQSSKTQPSSSQTFSSSFALLPHPAQGSGFELSYHGHKWRSSSWRAPLCWARKIWKCLIRPATTQWCENATQLSGTRWQYLKVGQKVFETLQPTKLEHLAALSPRQGALI